MVMAKGVEDCAFYRYSRLTSLNEVGGDPSVRDVAGEFHDAMAARQRDWPHAMTTPSTHDTKRGEDVRARITVLAEVPGRCGRRAGPAARAGAAARPGLRQPAVAGRPRRLAGVAASGCTRYAEKAMREAGDRTTWTEPDAAYEEAVHAAVDAAFDDRARSAPCSTGCVARRRRPGLEQRARGQAAGAHDARACPTSTRAASCGSRAWSTPTTGGRSTSTCAGAAGRLARRRPALTDAVDDPGPPSCWSPTRR